MNLKLKNIAGRILIFFLVVQTLNLSVNSLDFYTAIKTTNSVQDEDFVDSMIEFLVENVMGFSKDTFHDKANVDNNSKDQQNIAHFDLKWLPKILLITELSETVNEIKKQIPMNDRLVNLYFSEVPVKPPQFLSV